ncbi:MAG: ABC transporter substrate-binding protein, partial [Thermomicrobiaceae bacterium]|nr:ABC transporter substrate-binding protein [Thermomicrobiaceae bacterium]
MRRILLTLLIGLGLLAAACGSSGGAPTATSNAGAPAASPRRSATQAAASGTPTATAATPSGERVKVVLATGFVPSVQFAPYYLAADRGYYAAEGLDVEIKHGASADLLSQLGSGGIDFAVTTGDQLALARINGVPITYVMAQFQRYPVGAVALANSGVTLQKPADLKGLTVGVSQLNGSTYLGLLALLQAGGLTKDDVHIITIGFTEVEALLQKRVQAAMTYLTNEPAQVRALGVPVQQLAVSDYVQVVSTGLATSDKMIQEHPDVVQRFVRASLRGLRETLADPSAAFEATLKRMPELPPDQQPIQRQLLEHTLTFEQPPQGHPLGWTDPDAWVSTQDLLRSVGMASKTIDPT